jgi:hypothetical protein
MGKIRRASFGDDAQGFHGHRRLLRVDGELAKLSPPHAEHGDFLPRD